MEPATCAVERYHAPFTIQEHMMQAVCFEPLVVLF